MAAKKKSASLSNARWLDPGEVKASLERVSDGAGAEAVDSLLALWRDFPCEEIADAIDEVPLDPIFADVTSGTISEAIARLTRLSETPRDPRVSKLLVSWVADPPFHSMGSRPFHKVQHEEIVRHADPRALDALASAATSAKKAIKGYNMKAWVPDRAKRTIALLAKTYPSGSGPALPKGLTATLAKAKKAAIAGARANGKTSSSTTASAAKRSASTDRGDELLAAIHADPNDDAARAVYADWLIEKGNPRGEFIALQLTHGRSEPTDAQRKRELSLLHKHARIWLMDIIDVIQNRMNIVVGPKPANFGVRFERGFLVGCDVLGSTKRIKTLTGHRDWSTVEDLDLNGGGDDYVVFASHPVFRMVTRLATDTFLFSRLAAAKPLWQPSLERLRIDSVDDNEVSEVIEAAHTFPSLREIMIYSWELQPSIVRMVEEAMKHLPKLNRVGCGVNEGDPHFEFVRDGAASSASAATRTWTLSMKPSLKPAMQNTLRNLVR